MQSIMDALGFPQAFLDGSELTDVIKHRIEGLIDRTIDGFLTQKVLEIPDRPRKSGNRLNSSRSEERPIKRHGNLRDQ